MLMAADAMDEFGTVIEPMTVSPLFAVSNELNVFAPAIVCTDDKSAKVLLEIAKDGILPFGTLITPELTLRPLDAVTSEENVFWPDTV